MIFPFWNIQLNANSVDDEDLIERSLVIKICLIVTVKSCN